MTVGEIISGNITSLEFTNLYYSITSKLGEGSGMNSFIMAICLILCAVIPYFLGSINPAIMFSKLFFHDDVREHGSGNAGTTNILRTYGKRMAILTLFCDFLKAWISVGIGSFLFYKNVGGAIAGLFVVIGHMFPIFYKFKGGKGVACASAVVMILEPITFLCLLLIYIIIVVGTKYVSLASCMCIGLYPIIVSAFESVYVKAFSHDLGLIPATAVIMAVLVIYMHRANLKRLFDGKESKISFKSKKEGDADENENKKNADENLTVCECGRILPQNAKKCANCGRKNKNFVKPQKEKGN